ncbi:nuclear pore complex protein NUP160 isoform X1 [Cynara cardunculus var. scolymus]|uniref:nuclear pore complex protein NUP160 isoform X1 n=2 Tax=Cynara cardunculus var. scolymus TaxID=59895 RepID=UPI000D628873|nr:nuclear pore complex protein NUP160 isoform X1 [Cynara cardunculus var. scolymus]
MAARSSLAGIEVPIIGSDSIKWFHVSVPSTSTSTSTPPSPPEPFAPPTEDASSCCNIGDPPTYFIWRINKTSPNILEIVEFCSFAEFPRVGLQIEFANALCPFALICKNEFSSSSGNPYMLYTLTAAGVAYLIRLTDITNYASCSVFPPNEVVELNIQSYCNYGAITATSATAGCLIIGGRDGSVGCFGLGILDPSVPGFLHELRDDSSFGRLWNLMSRKTIAAVKGLLCLEIQGKKLIFVLHLDGVLRVWDLLSCSRLLSYTMNASTLEGTTFTRLWAGETNNDTSTMPLAILHKINSEVDAEMISLYSLHFSLEGNTNLFLEPSTLNISLEEGALIDVKLSSNKIWILKEDGLLLHNLGSSESRYEQCFGLQEAFVAEQLFQSSEHSADDLFWLAHSLYPSAKEQISPHVSTIFLRMLFLPGIYHNSVLRATLQEHNKHLTDSEFHSLTADGMKKEIVSVIEHEGVSRSSLSLLYCWKNFCSHYLDNWCNKNAPCGLLLDSASGAIGLIRKSSVSVLRCLEDIELLAFGSFDELGEIASSRINLSGDLEREVLFEVLRCTSSLSQQLGKGAAALFYESFFSEPSMSPEDVVGCLLKTLETRSTSSIAALHVSEVGVDTAWEKEVGDHKILRKFSADMFLSLHGLYRKASMWDQVVDVILKYLNFLVPQKIEQKLDYEAIFDISACITVQVTSQVAKVMFESAVDMLLLLSYMVKLGGQINMLPDDVSRVQLELFPLIQEIITEWHIIHFFGTRPCESPAMEDFSSQLSLLQIDSSIDRRSWNDKLGKCDFTLAFILLLDHQSSFGDQSRVDSRHLPHPSSFIAPVRNFISWIVWGRSEDGSSSFSSRSTMLALILLKHGQFDAVEHLLTLVNQNLLKEKLSSSIQGVNDEWCMLLHLLGCCLLAQAHRQTPRTSTDKKVHEAICCFFRVASLHGASKSLQSLSYESRFPHLGFSDHISPAAWKLHYYQWAMQIFEQYNMSAGACHFALAALEQVDEVLGLKDTYSGEDFLSESPTTAKGRLWANVFKFTLDLNDYYDAYCAIISNPDEESKYICLRRFIIVLYERGAIKVTFSILSVGCILCDGQLPFIGLTEKVEQELAWKAERSDVSVKPNPYKLLYAFEMHQHNWRKAASYMYLHSIQLKSEAALKDYQLRSLALQERLNCLSATINALHLVRPTCAWINPLLQGKSIQKELYPSKKARITIPEQEANGHLSSQKLDSCMDIEKLENEFVLTSAEYLLSLANIKWTFTGIEKPPPNLVELLVQSNLYDMVFTVILNFFKGSALKRELERVFIAMSLKCCPSRENYKKHGLLLTSSKDEAIHDSHDIIPAAQHCKGNDQWDALEQYMEKYKCFHSRLPVVVAETLLYADRLIELPLWLVQMFKCTLKGNWGMAGAESSPASLFQLYVDYGRYAEATNLLLHYIESVAAVRPADVIRRKKTSAVWFPYTTIERLWCKLEELISSGHMVHQCEKLRTLLLAALLKHFKLLNVDSEDVMSSSTS